MAGVGFELKKLFRQNGGYLNTAKAYAVSAVVTEGPLVLNIVMMVVLKSLMGLFHGGYADQEVFLITSTYIMIFSLMLSNTVLMFVSRYVSDCIYERRASDILPSFFAVVFYLLLFGGVVGMVYLSTLSAPPIHKLLNLVQFCVMLVVWVQMAYLSAIKKYTKILIGFLESTFLSIASALTLMLLKVSPLTAVFAASTLGVLVMMLIYLQEMVTYYPRGEFSLVGFFPALQKFKILIPVGAFMTFGLFGHNLVYWMSDYSTQVMEHMVYCMKYDVPCFYASLTIIPFLVTFTVSMEVKFFQAYRKCFDTIQYGGTLQHIMLEKESLCKTLFRELAHVFEVQFFIEVIAITFVGNILQNVQFDQEMMGIFRYLCIGYCFYALFKSLVIVLLYLDDRKGACMLSGLFALLSLAGSVAGLFAGIETWGLGFLGAAAITCVVGVIYVKHFVMGLEYHVFCTQPLVHEEPKGIFLEIARWVEHRERDIIDKRRMKHNEHL